MTWSDLQNLINKLSPEQRETDVTIYFPREDRFFPMFRFYINQGEAPPDVLDAEHPYLSDYF